jgi:hypothetical protein
MTPAEIEDEGDNEPRYSYRPAAFGSPRSFRLLANELEWEVGTRKGRVSYRRISRVRLSYRPATMQNHRFLTEIWSSETNRPLKILSSSWKSMVEQVRLDREYTRFISELHRRIAATGSAAAFDGGINPLLFGLGLLVFVAAVIGMAALSVRAIAAGAGMAAFLIGAFLLIFLWQAGNIFYRNRPGSYRPDALPPLLMPSVKD